MRSLFDGLCDPLQSEIPEEGHLFQNRYKSIVCEEDPYLLELVRYIHLNPLRAGIVGTLDELVREEELRNGGQRRKVSQLRTRVSYHLSRELGVPMAEIARHVGVCASAVVKAIQKMESTNQK